MTTCALLVAIPTPAQADVAGTARVIDGDTIVMNGEHVRLRGIDAPETDQTCSAYGQEWACGQRAANWLKSHVARRQVECVGHARDNYGRLLAVCYAGGESLNQRIVREGWALNFRRYSTDYLAAEDEAERNGAGIWRGEFTAPMGVAPGPQIGAAPCVRGALTLDSATRAQGERVSQ